MRKEIIHYVIHLITYAFPQNPLLYLSIILSLGSSVLEILAAFSIFPFAEIATGKTPALGDLIVRVYKLFGCAPELKVLIVGFMLILLARFIVLFCNNVLISFLSKRIQAQLSSDSFKHIISGYSLESIEHKSIGHFITLSGDEAFRASTVVIQINQFLIYSLMSIFYLTGIFFKSPPIGLSVIVFLGISSLGLKGVLKKSQELGTIQINLSKFASSIFLESLNSLRSIRSFSAEKFVTDAYHHSITKYTLTLFKVEFLNQVAKLLPILLLLFLILFPVSIGYINLGKGFDIVFAFTITILLMRFFPVIGHCLNIFFQIVSNAKAGMDITKVINDRIRALPDKGIDLTGPVNSIELRDLSFCYSEEKQPVLSHFSTRFEKGKSYAVMGPSGTGKSTLLNLILHFYHPQHGKILVNGEDIEKISQRSLRKRVVMLGQHSAIFNDSIENNIRFGLDINHDQVEKASRLACIHDWIEKLPRSYETVLEYQGNNLSGGQRQRVAIARVLLRDPDVLIFDESTNALDEDTKGQIIDNILSNFAGRIVIFVSHDAYVQNRVDEVISLSPVFSPVE